MLSTPLRPCFIASERTVIPVSYTHLLFNSSWGVAKYLNPAIGSEARILKYEGVDGDGFATFSTPAAISGSVDTFAPYHALSQCWFASIGIKYLFN